HRAEGSLTSGCDPGTVQTARSSQGNAGRRGHFPRCQSPLDIVVRPTPVARLQWAWRGLPPVRGCALSGLAYAEGSALFCMVCRSNDILTVLLDATFGVPALPTSRH